MKMALNNKYLELKVEFDLLTNKIKYLEELLVNKLNYLENKVDYLEEKIKKQVKNDTLENKVKANYKSIKEIKQTMR